MRVLVVVALLLTACTTAGQTTRTTTAEECDIIRVIMRADMDHAFGRAAGSPGYVGPDRAISSAELDNWQVSFASLGGDLSPAEIEQFAQDVRSAYQVGMNVECDGFRPPRAGGVSTVWSPLVFLRDREFAYAQYWTQWASLAGEGRECLLRRSSGSWQVLRCETTGVS